MTHPAPESAAKDSELLFADPSIELSSNRTSLAFERTRMSGDGTLMSIMRTALSLISFGFTIYEAFHQLAKSGSVAVHVNAARNFGLSLIILGILILAMGIFNHTQLLRRLAERRQRLFGLKLLRHEKEALVTPSFVVALLLLLIGLAAAASIIFRLGLM